MIQTRPSRFVLLAALCCVLAWFATEAGAEVRNPHGVAVIVGNKDYRHRDIPAVSFAHRDADAFRRYVVDVLGFNPENVIDLRDATRAKLLRTFGREQKKVSDLWAKLLPDQKWDVVVFYSGHGVPGLTDGKGYLLPVDVSPRAAQEEGYPLDLLYEKLGSLSNARSVQVYLDACFSGASDGGPLVRGASPVVVRPALPKGLAGKVTAVSASGADQIASWDVKARHGLFTNHLLDALYGKGDEKGNRDGKVTAREVKTYLDGYMTRAAWLQYGREQDANVMGAPGIVLASAPPGGFPKRPSLKGAPSVSSPPARGVAVTEPFALDRKKKVLVQRGLASLKFDPGPVDGAFGPKTREAIRGWQKAKGYEETGRLTKEQADALVAAGKSRGRAPSGEAEREFWASVKESKSPSDLEAYLKAYPEGEYARLARFRRDKLLGLDDASYARARSAGTAESYGEYLSSYPQGRHAEEARERLKEAKKEARARAEAERRAREAAEHERKVREAREAREAREREKAERARAILHPGTVFRDCPECPEMVVVPAGSFMMGSPPSEKDRDDDEGPRHQVTIPKPFAVGKYEVTVEEYRLFVAVTGRREGNGCYVLDGKFYIKEALISWVSPNFSQSDRHPVVCVNWNDARAYARWLSKKTSKQYRLLSESEWEYTARAGTTTRYNWGDDIGRNQANCFGCGSRWDNKQTAPVGSFPPNAFGLHDMHGNVWEWVADCRNPNYEGAPVDGNAWLSGECSERVVRGGYWGSWPEDLRAAVRGGSWDDISGDLRTAYRYGSWAGDRSIDFGFRVARTLAS